MSAQLTFVAPPPGFAPHTAFALDPIDGADGLFSLTAAEQPGLRVFVVDPATVVSDYAPTLTDEQTEELGLGSAEDALLLVVASRAADGVHVNLLAPIVAHRETGLAAQVILDGQDYPLRAPLG